MRRQIGGLVACGAAALALAGCSPQQQAEAGSSARRAKAQGQNALQQAKQTLSDDAVTLKVKTAMAASAKLNTSNIHVRTKERVVYLQGAAAGAQQKALAERIAKDTVGPDVRVVDQLQVSAPGHGGSTAR